MKRIFDIWLHETMHFFHDEGILVFLIVVPLAYPIAYSWIYNNEVVREVPVVVVDMDKSGQSREFIREYDASPNVRITSHAVSMDEAKAAVAANDAYGILYFPSDFSSKLNRMEQTTVGVYCDMTFMLAYKNVFQTATAVSGKMNAHIQTQLLGNTTARQDEISTEPMVVDEVSIFNTTGGYGNFILPAVLVLVIQQTILLAMGLTYGTRREKYKRIVPATPLYSTPLATVLGKAMAYLLITALTASYCLLVVPRLFSFVSIIYARDIVLFAVPYLLACIFFAMTVMSVMREREDCMLIVVFTSILLLFIAGVSWPSSSMPTFWKYISYIFPSTFGVKAFIGMNTMGARLADVEPHIIRLWVQAAVYFLTALLVHIIDKHKASDAKKAENTIKENEIRNN